MAREVRCGSPSRTSTAAGLKGEALVTIRDRKVSPAEIGEVCREYR